MVIAFVEASHQLTLFQLVFKITMLTEFLVKNYFTYDSPKKSPPDNYNKQIMPKELFSAHPLLLKFLIESSALLSQPEAGGVKQCARMRIRNFAHWLCQPCKYSITTITNFNSPDILEPHLHDDDHTLRTVLNEESLF